jgi:SAM-dependent methyltransferase
MSPNCSKCEYGRRVPDAIFTHPRLAPIYDAFDGERDDLTAYLNIAGELGANRVLDIGCGTGSLAVLLAENGRTVMGVDPAWTSLEVAKSKDKTATITWIHGDITKAPAFDADLAAEVLVDPRQRHRRHDGRTRPLDDVVLRPRRSRSGLGIRPAQRHPRRSRSRPGLVRHVPAINAGESRLQTRGCVEPVPCKSPFLVPSWHSRVASVQVVRMKAGSVLLIMRRSSVPFR